MSDIVLTSARFVLYNHRQFSVIKAYIDNSTSFPLEERLPWKIISSLDSILSDMIENLGDDYEVRGGVAIHKSAVIGHNVTIKAPAIICRDCFVGSNSYLRNGIFLAPGAKVGISCEIKTTVMLENSAVAHFNFVGDRSDAKPEDSVQLIPNATLKIRYAGKTILVDPLSLKKGHSALSSASTNFKRQTPYPG